MQYSALPSLNPSPHSDPSPLQVALRVRPMSRVEYSRGAVHAAQIVDSNVSGLTVTQQALPASDLLTSL